MVAAARNREQEFLVELLKHARGYPSEGNDTWVQSMPPMADGWEAFVNACKETILKVDANLLKQQQSRALELYEQDQVLSKTYNVTEDPTWADMKAAISSSRVASSARELVQSYMDPDMSKGDLRAVTRDHVATHSALQIPRDAFPPMLVARMKAAMKLQGPPAASA